MGEIWKDIPGYNGIYQASNVGNVRSIDRLITTKSGFVKPLKGKIMKGGLYPNGYCLVVLQFNGKSITTSKHILVAKAFIENPENKRCVNHKNSIRIDNRVENLEWVTHSENTKHGILCGRIKLNGSERKNAKLTDADIVFIRSSTMRNVELANKFGVCRSLITGITKGRRWKHITTNLTKELKA